MSKVFQEFYCTKSGGGCGGYFTVLLNMAISGVAEVICPKCSHKHQRTIAKGEIKEDKRFSRDPTQQIVTNIAAWSKKSRFGAMKDSNADERDGVIVSKNDEDRERFLRERKFEIHGG